MTLDWGAWLGEYWGLKQVEELMGYGAGRSSEEQDLSKESWKEKISLCFKGQVALYFQTAAGHRLPPHLHPYSSTDLAFLYISWNITHLPLLMIMGYL